MIIRSYFQGKKEKKGRKERKVINFSLSNFTNSIYLRKERQKREEKEERRMYILPQSDQKKNLSKSFQKDDDEGWTLPESQFVTEMIKPSTETYQSTFINQRKSSF
jgi:hypothetical protein